MDVIFIGLSLIKQYSKEELSEIVSNSFSYKEVAKKIGYRAFSGDLCKIIKECLKSYNIDTSHFAHKVNIKN